jgi:hypothetical protein
LTEIALESVIIWRLLLIISMVLILYEMIKWFRARTTSLEPWFDLPRIPPPPEEVEALAASVQSSYGDITVYSELNQRVHDDITDAVALILGLDEDELRKLVLDEQFVKKTFGTYSTLVSHLLKDKMTDSPTSTIGREELSTRSKMEVFLHDINLLLDQVKRWEKHEGQRSLRTR